MLIFCAVAVLAACAPGLSSSEFDPFDGNQIFSAPSVGDHNVEEAPLWESKSTDTRNWTLFSFDMIEAYGSNLMAGPNDVASFCPNYKNLSTNQKENFWVYLISAIAKFESSFDPTARYEETTMGTDPITGLHVYSEGLLQLSYQDVQAYPYCNEFNWSIDRNLSPTNPRKTIFDPYKNLRCGIRILNEQVRKKGLISYDSGNYWYTLQPKHNPVYSIQNLTKGVSFCH